MAPELKTENKEFDEWLAHWVAKIQSRVVVEHTHLEKKTSTEEYQSGHQPLCRSKGGMQAVVADVEAMFRRLMNVESIRRCRRWSERLKRETL